MPGAKPPTRRGLWNKLHDSGIKRRRGAFTQLTGSGGSNIALPGRGVPDVANAAPRPASWRLK